MSAPSVPSVHSVLQSENIFMEENCVVCFENFIDIQSSEYWDWLQNKINTYPHFPKHSFEDETCSGKGCYDEKFQCNTCNNLVCRGCVEDTHQGIVYAKFQNKDGHLEQDGYSCGIRELTNYEITYIKNDGYDIKNIIDSENSNEIYQIPRFTINGTIYYDYMRGIPGEDGPIKCPICRQLDSSFEPVV